MREDIDGIRRLTKHYLELRGERRYRWNNKRLTKHYLELRDERR